MGLGFESQQDHASNLGTEVMVLSLYFSAFFILISSTLTLSFLKNGSPDNNNNKVGLIIAVVGALSLTSFLGIVLLGDCE